jgi:hypothetical protein
VEDRLEKARQELTEKVMGKKGVNGTAIAERGGKPCLVVYLKDRKSGKHVPEKVGGFKVVKEVTGEIRPL